MTAQDYLRHILVHKHAQLLNIFEALRPLLSPKQAVRMLVVAAKILSECEREACEFCERCSRRTDEERRNGKFTEGNRLDD